MGTISYGGPTDTWGLTGLIPSDLRDPNFGVALSAKNTSLATNYPVIAGRATSRETRNTFNHDITLPGGIVPGDLLIILWSDANRPNAVVPIPSGWQELYRSVSAGGARRIAWYKIAVGDETSFTLQTSGGNGNDIRSAHNSYRILAGTFQGVPKVETPVTGNSISPNPPSLSGFVNYSTLWIAAVHTLSSLNVTAPGDYPDLIERSSGATGTGDATMASATKESGANSEDPGIFTISNAYDWAANTIAIQGVPNAMDAKVDFIQVTVTARVNGVLNWYTSEIGGTPIGTGSPFNPVGVANSGLPNTNIPGTTTFYAECSNVPGCRTATNFVINPNYL